MTSIRPQDLPEVRAGLLQEAADWFQDGTWDRMAAEPYYRLHHDSIFGRIDGPALRSAASAGLQGQMYFMSRQMTDLTYAAGESLPPFTLSANDAPSPNGLLLFEKAVDDWLKTPSGEMIPVAGACWAVISGGIWITPIVQIDIRAFSLPSFLPFPPEGFEAPGESRPYSDSQRLVLTLRAAWLLMQQPLTRTTEVEPDRAARKRLRRMNHEPALVRVIELRRPASVSGGHGESGREYHHQWITRGHWRNQWHPKREVHRPVWIAPHIKGPAGAPLIGGEKVYALKR